MARLRCWFGGHFWVRITEHVTKPDGTVLSYERDKCRRCGREIWL